MSDGKACLPFREGFHVAELTVGPDLVQIALDANSAQPLLRGGCRRTGLSVHEYCCRRIRDLPMLGKAVVLHVTLRRVVCPDCGTRMEAVSWLDRHARITRHLADTVAMMCTRLPTAHVAELFGLHWSAVRTLDRRRLQGAVLDADTRRVLWIGMGRSRAAIKPFSEALGQEGCARIQAVAMDMNTAFDLVVRHHCRQARIIYDLFHDVAKYGREVIGRARVDAANQLRHDKPARRVVKRAHWLLLRNPANLKTPAQRYWPPTNH